VRFLIYAERESDLTGSSSTTSGDDDDEDHDNDHSNSRSEQIPQQGSQQLQWRRRRLASNTTNEEVGIARRLQGGSRSDSNVRVGVANADQTKRNVLWW